VAETEALYWAALDVPAPKEPQLAEYEVRFIPGRGEAREASASRFTVAAA